MHSSAESPSDARKPVVDTSPDVLDNEGSSLSLDSNGPKESLELDYNVIIDERTKMQAAVGALGALKYEWSHKSAMEAVRFRSVNHLHGLDAETQSAYTEALAGWGVKVLRLG